MKACTTCGQPLVWSALRLDGFQSVPHGFDELRSCNACGSTLHRTATPPDVEAALESFVADPERVGRNAGASALRALSWFLKRATESAMRERERADRLTLTFARTCEAVESAVDAFAARHAAASASTIPAPEGEG